MYRAAMLHVATSPGEAPRNDSCSSALPRSQQPALHVPPREAGNPTANLGRPGQWRWRCRAWVRQQFGTKGLKGPRLLKKTFFKQIFNSSCALI